ncbi:MAG TPA: single-stranded DNA-binding protein [Clostridia bacterium]|jgi:single-strand DNA-binding protein|nr:single-stranded DNA-binding protein [Clostridia bacterium]HOK82118.1 single-stranded DNA-binding protein [Clostridia bacterium]HOL61058.1 single-stranded DNA-binding protein [Clostridia bacterium]HPO53970.1 single-stranded DNA-binding protein [Clostridia bacterium]
MNKVILIGNLTRDPETNTTNSGIKVCKFTIAVNRNYSSVDGTRQTDFLPVICWRNQAENCGKFLRKGSKVGICGSIQTRSYDGPDGSKRYVTEIVADEVQFLSTRSEGFPDDTELLERRKVEELQPIPDGDLPF